MPDRYVLVLAGGRGERFWPWSRPERPKQLLPLAPGGRSLLAATLDRALRLAPAPGVLVLTASALVPSVREQCPAGVRVLGEPAPRNTAPAIGLAAGLFHATSQEASFAVLPADHAVDDEGAFVADLTRGFKVAEKEAVLVTFGVRPSTPEPNFGYIRPGTQIADRLSRVAAFTEKPERAVAERYVNQGYLWNTGIFVWRARVFLDALRAARPVLAATLAPLGESMDDAEWERRMTERFPACESISVDYAVMERAPNVLVFEASFDWDDLGSWGAWARRQARDDRGNVRFGRTVVLDCDRCVVVGDGGIAAAVGLRDMVVVHAGGATLACRIDRTEDVRAVSEAARVGHTKETR